MQTIRNFLRGALFWAVLLLAVALLVMTMLPRAFGYTPVGIRDDSMEPLLHRGDLVLTKPVSFEEVQVGDLLTVYDPAASGGRYTRAVAEIWTETQEFVTQSPEANTPDPYTTPFSYVTGRVEHTVRFAGYSSVWLHTTVGKVVFALLLIFWVAAEIESFSVSKRREKTNA